jgi:hypothetical protein
VKGLLQALFIWKIYPTLPLASLGVAILLGAIEMLVSIVISAKIVDLYGDFTR